MSWTHVTKVFTRRAFLALRSIKLLNNYSRMRFNIGIYSKSLYVIERTRYKIQRYSYVTSQNIVTVTGNGTMVKNWKYVWPSVLFKLLTTIYRCYWTRLCAFLAIKREIPFSTAGVTKSNMCIALVGHFQNRFVWGFPIETGLKCKGKKLELVFGLDRQNLWTAKTYWYTANWCSKLSPFLSLD